jgi:CBS domain containing-hemolysin-like protein
MAKANLLQHYSTNETLPIFLDSILGGGVLAVISSTALILLFGEVIPQGTLLVLDDV